MNSSCFFISWSKLKLVTSAQIGTEFGGTLVWSFLRNIYHEAPVVLSNTGFYTVLSWPWQRRAWCWVHWHFREDDQWSNHWRYLSHRSHYLQHYTRNLLSCSRFSSSFLVVSVYSIPCRIPPIRSDHLPPHGSDQI